MKVASALFALLGFPLLCCAFYAEDSPVKLIQSTEEFQNSVLGSEEVSVVEFFAPWCGHCKNLAPTIVELAKEMEGVVPVYAVDCEEEDTAKLCGDHGVEAFPTIKVFPAEPKKNPYTGAFYKEPVDYKGKGIAKDMKQAAYKLLPDRFITVIKSLSQWAEFTAIQTKPIALLLSENAAPSALFKSLSLRFHSRLACAKSQGKVPGIKAAVSVTKTPALVLLKGFEVIAFKGNLTAAEVFSFLDAHAPAAPEASAPISEKLPAGGEKVPTKGRPSATTQKSRAFAPQSIQLQNVKESIAESDSAWLIAVFKGVQEDCSKDLSAWEEAVEKLANLTATGTAFIGDSDLDLAGSFGLDPGFWSSEECAPQVLLLPSGDKEDQDWSVYNGSISAKALQQFALGAFSSTVVLRLTAETLPHSLGINPTRPKLVLFTEKPATPPIFAALAANFQPQGADFFDVHSSDAEVAKQFGVTKFPALVLAFLPPDVQWQEGEKQRMAVQPYTGPLKYPQMARFVSSVLEALSAKKGSKASGISVKDVTGDESAFQEHCGGQGLCMIYLTRGIEEAAENLEALKAAAAREELGGLRYLAVRYEEHPELAGQVGLAVRDLPALLAYRSSKLRVAVLKNAVEELEIAAFLSGLMNGTVATSELKEPLSLSGGRGSEAEPEVAEEQTAAAEEPAELQEEFDLADILAENVDSTSKSKADIFADLDAKLEEKAGEEASVPVSEEKAKKKRRKKGKKRATKAKTEL